MRVDWIIWFTCEVVQVGRGRPQLGFIFFYKVLFEGLQGDPVCCKGFWYNTSTSSFLRTKRGILAAPSPSYLIISLVELAHSVGAIHPPDCWCYWYCLQLCLGCLVVTYTPRVIFTPRTRCRILGNIH